MKQETQKPLRKKRKNQNRATIDYYYLLFVCIIFIEIFLIYTSSKKYKEQKDLLKHNYNLIVNKKSNISRSLKEIEQNEQLINSTKKDMIFNNNISLQSYKLKQINLININNNLSKLFHKSFEEYEKRKEIFEDEIIEKNNTIKRLYEELKEKVLIRTKLEEKLDEIEEIIIGDVQDVKIKSTILENNEDKQKLLIKWISGTAEREIKKIQLIFSAVEHDFDSFSFHEICGDEDIDNTLIIIKTENNDIIGGFTYASWMANSLISFDDKAFVFNLNKELKIRISNPSYAIHSRINDGPIFGIYDLIVNSNKIKVQEKMESYGDRNLGIDLNVVNIINYEVFTVIFK